ncbi:WD40 repeat domain-containing protein [Streptomyces fructofermentans]|uniref:WD40 repeat domain-containing protein n=1 Tax=Streptomyces fructofermentans TaxID=152141 RepID=UPI0033C5BFBD
MSDIGELLAQTKLDFAPSEIAWGGNGLSLTAFGPYRTNAPYKTQKLSVLDAGSGEIRWSTEALDMASAVISPDGQAVVGAGGDGPVEPIEKFVPFLDCSDIPPQEQEECERFNQEEAGLHIVGWTPPPHRTWARAMDSSVVLWRWDDPDGNVRHLTHSPDGKLLAGSGTGLLVLDALNGTLKSIFPSVVSQLPAAYTRDSQQLAASNATSMILVDVTAGAVRWTTGLPAAITAFAFTPDETALIVTTEHEAFTLRAEDGVIRETVALEEPVLGTAVTALSNGGRRLLRVGPQAMVLWDVTDGGRRFSVPVSASTRVRFNPVLPEIAIASASGVKVVNSLLGTTVWEKATDPLTGLAFSRDGQRLALGGQGQGTGFLHLHSMAPTSMSSLTFEGPVREIALTSAPEPLAVAAGHEPEAKASLFRADTGEPVLEKKLPGEINSLEFSPDGRHFATGNTDGGVRLFRTDTGERRWLAPYTAPVEAVTFLPSGGGDDVVMACRDKTARRLTLDDKKEVWMFKHPQPVTRVTTSADGRFVATACADRSTRILAPDTGAELAAFSHDGRIRALAFSAPGSLLATGGDDGAVLIISTATGKEIGRSQHTSDVTAVAFSQDGKLLATAGKDETVHLWDVEADPPKKVRTLTFPQTITRLLFHPTEPQLALVNDDPHPTVVILEPATDTELARLAHPATVNDLAFSPDGKLLATACTDGLARVYPGLR